MYSLHKEALFYSKMPGNSVRCNLCPHFCLLNPQETGLCRNRANENGVLLSLNYQKLIAFNVDPIEKKPLYHFLPGSDVLSVACPGCNLSCLNCQNHQISHASALHLDVNNTYSPQKIINFIIDNNYAAIAFTYTEPIVYYEYMLDIARLAKEKNIFTILISAGYINDEPLQQLLPFIDAANIDLKSFNKDTYKRLNGIRLSPVLNTLKSIKESNTWLEITNLVVSGWNDNIREIRQMCHWLADNGFEFNPIHFSRFHPTFKLSNLNPTPEKTLENAKNEALNSGIKYVYIGNVQGYDNNTYCHNCQKMIIDRNGYFAEVKKIKDGKCVYCQTTIPGYF